MIIKKGSRHNVILIIFCVTVVFLIAIARDITPYLRGPAVWPPEWRWPYLFVNTLPKIWLPIIVSFFGLIFFRIKKISVLKLLLLCLWGFAFQLSVLYFSRAGIGVLLHRIINPFINGYFTVAVRTTSVLELLSHYEEQVLFFPMHAKGHPPGGIIFFMLIVKVVQSLSPLSKHLISLVSSPSTPDVFSLWQTLMWPEKTAALVSTLLIPLISTLTVMPLFYLTQAIYDQRTALFTGIIYLVIPALVSFVPLFDTILPLFTVLTALLLTKRKEVLSGLIFSLGVFFSLSLLPAMAVLFLWLFFIKSYRLKTKVMMMLKFLSGFIFLQILLLCLNYNPFGAALTILKGQADRSYLIWVIYNLYDFFVFVGLPISILFLVKFLSRDFKSGFVLPLVITLLLLTVSGLSRAETGRIWLPLMPFVVIEAAACLRTRLSIKPVFLIFSLVVLQTLCMTEFWVTLW